MSVITRQTAYAPAIKKAVVKATSKKSAAKVAAIYGVSKSSVCKWKSEAGKQGPQPVGLARHQAALAEIKAFNTPTLVGSKKASEATHIVFRGKKYKIK